MKKLLTYFAIALTGAPVFAQETGGSSSSGPDFSAATDALESVSGAITDWVGDVMPYLVGIASAVLIFWLGRLVFRLVKSWMSAAR